MLMLWPLTLRQQASGSLQHPEPTCCGAFRGYEDFLGRSLTETAEAKTEPAYTGTSAGKEGLTAYFAQKWSETCIASIASSSTQQTRKINESHATSSFMPVEMKILPVRLKQYQGKDHF